MGQDAIERKLKQELSSNESWSESRVVYVLVEIRKYIEQQRQLRKRYPALNFFCCWALHSKAKGEGADRILKRFDDAHPHFENMGIQPVPDNIIEGIGRTLSLSSFRTDLERFLSERSLPTSVANERIEWLLFLQQYTAVIEDCPFILSSNSKITLSHVKRIVVTTLPTSQGPINLPAGHTVVFRAQWLLIGHGDQNIGKLVTPFNVR